MTVSFDLASTIVPINYSRDMIFGDIYRSTASHDLHVTHVLAGQYNGATSMKSLPTVLLDLTNQTSLKFRFAADTGYAFHLTPELDNFQGSLVLMINLILDPSRRRRFAFCNSTVTPQVFSTTSSNDLFLRARFLDASDQEIPGVILVSSSASISNTSLSLSGTASPFNKDIDITAIEIDVIAPRGHLELVSCVPLVASEDSFLRFDFFTELFVRPVSNLRVVNVQDIVPPMLECPTSVIGQTAIGSAEGYVSYGEYNVSDNVDNVTSLAVNVSHASSSSFKIGMTQVSMSEGHDGEYSAVHV